MPAALRVARECTLHLYYLPGILQYRVDGSPMAALQKYRKALCSSVKNNAIWQTRKTIQNLVRISILLRWKTPCGNPYKTCQIWRLLGAISRKVTQNHQNMFISKKNAILQSRKTLSPLVKSANLLKWKTPCGNPYKTCQLWRLLGANSGKVTQSIKKHYVYQ